MSAILWPLAVVCFDIIVFSTAVFLVRLAARDRRQEEQEIEQAEQLAFEPAAIEPQPEQGLGHIPAMG